MSKLVQLYRAFAIDVFTVPASIFHIPSDTESAKIIIHEMLKAMPYIEVRTNNQQVKSVCAIIILVQLSKLLVCANLLRYNHSSCKKKQNTSNEMTNSFGKCHRQRSVHKVIKALSITLWKFYLCMGFCDPDMQIQQHRTTFQAHFIYSHFAY